MTEAADALSLAVATATEAAEKVASDAAVVAMMEAAEALKAALSLAVAKN
jgi:hypothetical protein